MREIPFYKPVGNEKEVFRAAWNSRHALMLKGPTGVGKTRLVEAMSAELDRPLITVSCHEDLTAADLLGRYLLKGGETEWMDGTGERQNGILTGDDMAKWHATIEAPLSLDYAGYEIHKTSSWGQGPVALQMLSILKGYELADLDPVGADFIHLFIEANKAV